MHGWDKKPEWDWQTFPLTFTFQLTLQLKIDQFLCFNYCKAAHYFCLNVSWILIQRGSKTLHQHLSKQRGAISVAVIYILFKGAFKKTANPSYLAVPKCWRRCFCHFYPLVLYQSVGKVEMVKQGGYLYCINLYFVFVGNVEMMK